MMNVVTGANSTIHSFNSQVGKRSSSQNLPADMVITLTGNGSQRAYNLFVLKKVTFTQRVTHMCVVEPVDNIMQYRGNISSRYFSRRNSEGNAYKLLKNHE